MRATLAVFTILAAIVAANLVTTEFGPSASVVNAFFLIGLTLTVRDYLHDLWIEHRALKMGVLIAAGAVLAYLVNHDAAQVAKASAIAFAAAESIDFIVYQLLRERGWRWLERASSSNFVSAAVDSLVFPTIAFGGLLWSVTLGQFTAKVAGGLLFALLLNARRPVEATA